MAKLVPKEMPEPRGTLGYRAPLGRRVTLEPRARPELKVILAARVIPGLPEFLELPEHPVPLVVPD